MHVFMNCETNIPFHQLWLVFSKLVNIGQLNCIFLLDSEMQSEMSPYLSGYLRVLMMADGHYVSVHLYLATFWIIYTGPVMAGPVWVTHLCSSRA